MIVCRDNPGQLGELLLGHLPMVKAQGPNVVCNPQLRRHQSLPIRYFTMRMMLPAVFPRTKAPRTKCIIKRGV